VVDRRLKGRGRASILQPVSSTRAWDRHPGWRPVKRARRAELTAVLTAVRQQLGRTWAYGGEQSTVPEGRFIFKRTTANDGEPASAEL
jgi:hypothetical protein